MSNFFHYNRQNQTKRESKAHKKKITTNSLNEQFTIYSNVMNEKFSQNTVTPHKLTHHKIQRMKEELMFQMEQKNQYTISNRKSIFEPKLALHDDPDYNVRLENLKNNLQMISKKSYNETQSQNSTKRYDKNSKISYLQTKPKPVPINKSTISMEFNYVPRQNDLQYYQHQSEEIQIRPKSKTKSFKESKKKETNTRVESSINLKKKSYGNVKKSLQSELQTIHVVNPPKIPSSSSNVIPRKLIQKHRNNSNQLKSSSASKGLPFLQKVGSKKIHRARITQIIQKNEQIFTSSLDYTVKMQDQIVGESEQLYRHRGGVEGMILMNENIFSVGRDLYLKNGDNQYKFDSCPKFLSPLSDCILTIGCSSQLHIFDIVKFQSIRNQSISIPYTLHSKDYVSYLSTSSALSVIDIRCSSMLQSLYKFPRQTICKWALHPIYNECAIVCEDKIEVIDAKKRKLGEVSLNRDEEIRQMMWNENELFYLTSEGTVKTWDSKQTSATTIDMNNDASMMRINGNIIYFGDSQGNMVTKIYSH